MVEGASCKRRLSASIIPRAANSTPSDTREDLARYFPSTEYASSTFTPFDPIRAAPLLPLRM
jgi:hypothetical protein